MTVIKKKWISFIYFCVLLSLHQGMCHSTTDQPKSMIQKLRRDLLKNYDKLARPVLDDSNTTEVSLGIAARYIYELDEEREIFKLESWLKLMWTDDHLTWNAQNYSGMSVIHLSANEIWKPDISVYSSLPVSQLSSIIPTNILAYPTGMILWVPPSTLNSYCKLEYTNYPNDIQECNITFGSWTHHGLALDLKLYEDNVDVGDFSNTNPYWELISTFLDKKVTFYECCPEPYPSIVASFKIKRRQPTNPHCVIWNASIVAVLFTLAMFWLPSYSTQKIVLGCTSVIILTVLLLYIGETVSLPIIAVILGRYIHSTMYIVASALIMEIIIINLGRFAGPYRPPSVLINILSGTAGRIMLICTPKNYFEDKTELIEEREEENKHRNASEEWYLVSIAFDRIFFMVYLLMFIIQRNI